MNQLKDFQNNMAKNLYGKTKDEAVTSGLCIDCNEPALENCYSDAGRKEFRISGLCEKCYDKIFS